MKPVLLTPSVINQPPLVNANLRCELTVAISSLSIGGAERIVLDWASRIHPRWRVHLIVLRNREPKEEWSVPPFVRVTRVSDQKPDTLPKDMHGHRLERLRQIGREIAESENPICVCHLLEEGERNALAESGARIVTVLHNAKSGWSESVERLKSSMHVVAISGACRDDLRKSGYGGPVSVIRHIPPRPVFKQGAREKFRASWGIPKDAVVVGMIGAVKAQKNYAQAVKVIKKLHAKRDAYLVIVGGPLLKNGRKDLTQSNAVLDEIKIQGVRHRVAMPGFIEGAVQCLSAFDAVLNTSHFEGLSIATLEALLGGLPVVASHVGGQGELTSDGLMLLSPEASIEAWADALDTAIQVKVEAKVAPPSWASFQSHHLWTLAGLARDIEPTKKVLFVTANLNSGGAQRSLVNLSLSLAKRSFPFDVAVAGNSTDEFFYSQLRGAGIRVERLADCGKAFNNAEALIFKICSENIGTVCFWNLDSKVKLLVIKALGFSKVRFIDVSPGDESFDLIEGGAEFQRLIGFSKEEFYARLDHLVMKYSGRIPALCRGKTSVIRNGIPLPRRVKTQYGVSARPRVVVNGRIAPTKFLLEILEAMRIVRKKIPGAELHVFGAAEPCRAEYGEQVLESAKLETGTSVFFYGLNFNAVEQLPEFDAYVVLGKDQGCPNALLEALACGLPAVANDDGGTREQLIDMETGLLIKDRSPELLAQAVIRILSDRGLARRLGQTGRQRVLDVFSMGRMTNNYLRLFGEEGTVKNKAVRRSKKAAALTAA